MRACALVLGGCVLDFVTGILQLRMRMQSNSNFLYMHMHVHVRAYAHVYVYVYVRVYMYIRVNARVIHWPRARLLATVHIYTSTCSISMDTRYRTQPPGLLPYSSNYTYPHA